MIAAELCVDGPLAELIKRSYKDGFCDKKGKRTKNPIGLNWQMNLATAGRTPTDPPSLRSVALLRVDKRKGLMFLAMGGAGGSRAAGSNSSSSVGCLAASVNIHGTALPPCEEQWRFEGNIVADPSALSEAPHSMLAYMLARADESNGGEATMTSLELASRAKKYEDDMDDTGFWIGKRPEDSLPRLLVRANVMTYYLQPTWAQLVVGGPASAGGPQKTTWTRMLPSAATTAGKAEAMWSSPNHAMSSSPFGCQAIMSSEQAERASPSDETIAAEVLPAPTVSPPVAVSRRSTSSWWGSVFAFFLLVSLASLGEKCCVNSTVFRQQPRFGHTSWSRNTKAVSLTTLLAATTPSTTETTPITTTAAAAAALQSSPSLSCLVGRNVSRAAGAFIDEPTRAFLSWATEVGIESPKVEVYRNAETGLRGLRAVADIADGEVFLRVPLSACISPSSPSSSCYSSSLVWQVRLALRLIEESRLRETSHWHPYMLALLDEDTRADLRASLPVHWTDELLAEGESSSVAAMADLATEARRAKAWRDDQWLALTQQQQQQSSDNIVDNNGFTGSSVTREEFDWALDCVQTRNCRVGSGSASSSSIDDTSNVLAPFFDLMNHDPSVNSVFFLSEEHDNDNHESSAHTSSMMLCVRYEGHGVSRGGDVCLNYRNVNNAVGEGDTSEQPVLFGLDYYLFSYGFVPTPSPSDSSSLFVEVSLPRARVRDVLMADLIGAGAPPSHSSHLQVSRAARTLGVRLSSPFPVFTDGIGEQFMTALRLLAVAASDPSDAQYADEALLIKAVGTTGFAVDVETRAMDILAETLQTAVDSVSHMVEANGGEQNPPRSLLHALARHKLQILTDCQQWAVAYRNTLLAIP